MATVEELLIRLKADNTDLKNKLSESEKSVGGFGGAVGKLGPMIAGAFAVGSIVAFGKAAYMAAEQQEQANKRLLFAVNNNTKAFKDLSNQAEELREATGIDDAAIMQIQQLGANADYSTDRIKNITEASVELSAVTGQDLQSAYMQLNATFNGSAGRLTRLDADFGKLSETQLRNGEAIDLVLQKYKGFAANSATEIQKLSSNWDELTERLGTITAPVLNSFFKKLNADLAITTSNSLTFWEKLTNSREGANALIKARKEVEENRKAWQLYDIQQSLVGWEKTEDGVKAVAAAMPKAREEFYKLHPPMKQITADVKDQKTELDKWAETMEKIKYLQDFNVPTPSYGETGKAGVTTTKSKGITQIGDPGKLAVRGQKDLGTAIKTTTSDLEKQQDVMYSIAQMMGDMGKIAGESFGEQSAAYKAFAISTAVISTYLAATAALAPPPMGYGPVAGIPAAIGITAMGLFNVAKIAGAFASGGIVGGSSYSGDSMTARVNSGEMILNGSQQRELFAMANGMGRNNQVEVVGYISGDVIRLANKRGTYLNERRG